MVATKILEQDFCFSASIWHEVYSKLILNEIEEELLTHLRIADYTTEVKQYFFVFIAVHSDNPNHDNWAKYFSRKKGILYHNLKLDFERFEKATQEEANQMQAELYLQSILEIPTLRGMKKVAFDVQKFYADTQNLFLQKGWLKTENQSVQTN